MISPVRRRILRHLWAYNDSLSYAAQLSLPNIPVFPLFTALPFIIEIVTTTAPLSEPSQRITNRDVDPEKGDEVKMELQTMEQVVVNAEDEKFEWREVVRGTSEITLETRTLKQHFRS